MNISEAITFLKSILYKTNKKSEIKIYENFVAILTSLKSRDLTNEQLKLIEEELSSLNLKANPENNKKYLKRKLAEFKKYLKDEFSLIPEGYYTAIGMSLGMSFGVAIGVSFGESTGIALGISMGMLIGLVIGRRKDEEAKKQNRVLRTKN
jgi:hypothetical protein